MVMYLWTFHYAVEDVRNDDLTVHGQEDPRDDEVYPEQENQADQGSERLTVKALKL